MAIPAGPDLEYVRGDLAPLTITFKQADGTVYDWTGHTDIKLTVNIEKEPSDANNQVIQFDGTAVSPGTSGAVDFEPPDQASSDNLAPETYFYDVAALDGSGRKVTLLLGGKIKIKQDINKD